jgi:hypothetical protein
VSKCDDRNACTADACLPTGECGHDPVGCDDLDACTVDSCDPALGCVSEPIAPSGTPEAACDDGKDNDCDGATDAVDADCASPCEGCDPNADCHPEQTPACVCREGYSGDGDSCVRDGTGCWDALDNDGDGDIDCRDRNGCDGQACDLQGHCGAGYAATCNGGACESELPSAPPMCCSDSAQCQDDSACTAGVCRVLGTGYGCVFLAISCDDRDACTVDSCASSTGCRHTPRSCDDGRDCTTDSCNAGSGCRHEAVPGCTEPPACLEHCTAGQECAACNDHVVCTDDICDAVAGCTSVPTTHPPEESELTCDDRRDNDCDGAQDGDDADCDPCAECGAGARCFPGSAVVCVCAEGYSGDGITCVRDGTGCWDAIDNDADGRMDCHDVEGCQGQACDLQDICDLGSANYCDDQGQCKSEGASTAPDCCFDSAQCDAFSSACIIGRCTRQGPMQRCIYTSVQCDDGD